MSAFGRSLTKINTTPEAGGTIFWFPPPAAEAEKVLQQLPLKYPDAPPGTASMQMPTPEEVALFRVEPEIISVLDYTKGFAHTDLVSC